MPLSPLLMAKEWWKISVPEQIKEAISATMFIEVVVRYLEEGMNGENI